MTHKRNNRSGRTRFLLPACALWIALSASSAAQADQITIDARDFMPNDAGTYSESSAGNLTCSAGNNQFTAQVPFPPRSLTIKQIAFWGGDFIAADARARFFRYCQPEFQPGAQTVTEIAEIASSGNGGNYFDAQAMNLPVNDQTTCVYVIQAALGQDACPGGSLSIARVRVRYDVAQEPGFTPTLIFKNGFED